MSSILVVDDSAALRTSIKFVLTQEGFSVEEAPDGSDALEIAKKRAFDLIITDVNMPSMDGIELTRRIRAGEGGEANKTRPILVLTTESQVSRMEEGKAAGATGWIVKPFETDRMLAAVKKLVG
jgi:two-component system chemotaxis response regulator CheY